MSNFSNVGYTTDNDSEGGTPVNTRKNTNLCSHSYEFINKYQLKQPKCPNLEISSIQSKYREMWKMNPISMNQI